MTLTFTRRRTTARFRGPSGEALTRPVEIRTNPVSGRTSRITFSRSAEKEAGTRRLVTPPPAALDPSGCPFCAPNRGDRTPRLDPAIASDGYLRRGSSTLFPNLFPYGAWSAVSLIDDTHFVPIGRASAAAYADSLANAADYLARVRSVDPRARYVAITQNHLPSAGGSLLHPHLQVHADRLAANHQRVLRRRAAGYFKRHGGFLFADYLAHERPSERYIGRTGRWEWVAAFAPEGFFEIWGILPEVCSLQSLASGDWASLAQGVVNVQGLYRRLRRNGYNLGLLAVEAADSRLELRAVMLVRSNYAPWVRNDHTGFEVMLGEMATFSLPEETAALARQSWQSRPQGSVPENPDDGPRHQRGHGSRHDRLQPETDDFTTPPGRHQAQPADHDAE